MTNHRPVVAAKAVTRAVRFLHALLKRDASELADFQARRTRRRVVRYLTLMERASASSWTTRSNIPAHRLAVGQLHGDVEPDKALLSLRLGTAHLDGQWVAHASGAGPSLLPEGSKSQLLLVHDWWGSGQLQWDGHFVNFGAAAPQAFQLSTHSMFAANDFALELGQVSVLLRGATATRLGDLFSQTPSLGGQCERVAWGDLTSSRLWQVSLIGVGMPEFDTTSFLNGVRVSFAKTQRGDPPTLHPKLERIHMGEKTLGEIWRTIGAQAPPNGVPLPHVVDVVLEFPELVTVEAVNDFVENHLTWVLDIYAGRRVIPLVVTQRSSSSFASAGMLSDYGRLLVQPTRRIVSSGTLLSDYLHDVLPSWEVMTEDERQIARIAVGARHATAHADVETSINVAALALELLIAEWLPATKATYELTAAQKKAITKALVDVIQSEAPGTSFAAVKTQIAGNIFRRPARGPDWTPSGLSSGSAERTGCPAVRAGAQ